MIKKINPSPKGIGKCQIHHRVNGPNTGTNSGGRWIIKNKQKNKLKIKCDGIFFSKRSMHTTFLLNADCMGSLTNTGDLDFMSLNLCH